MFANALKKFVVGVFANEIFAQQTRWAGGGKSWEEQFTEMKTHVCNWVAQKSLQARSSKDGTIDEIHDGCGWHDIGEHYSDEN